ncbi:MAG TPA: alpha/beta hydrolase [Polyangiaceae bacterium]|nr:alpha/beta hydrolase [Polyangiaceae bacterium]
MLEALHTVLVPGLLCTPRLYAEQLPALWRLGPVTLADHTRDADMASIARRILASAPAQFALVALSMGGYISFEILRQAPERVLRLVLLDTTARSDTPEQSEVRRGLMALATEGRFAEVSERLFPRFVHRQRHSDLALRQLVRAMAEQTGAEAFLRQEAALLSRPDSRANLSAIRCPTTVIVGDGDELTPPELAREIANGIAGARLIEIPGSGHLSTLERPEEVTAALVQALTAR